MPVGKKEGFCNTVDVGEKKKKEYCDSSDNVFYDRIWNSIKSYSNTNH